MTGKEKIESILAELGIKAPTFASNIGVKYQRILDIQNGKTKKISGDVANAIKLKYPQFDITWLLTGEGEMLKPKTEPYQSTDGSITLSADVWKLINIQAESIKIKDQQTAEAIDVIKRQAESLKIKDQQTSEVIELLKDQLKKGESAGNVKSAVG